MFYAKLALAIIYDDFINNHKYEERIINHLTRNDDDDDDDL